MRKSTGLPPNWDVVNVSSPVHDLFGTVITKAVRVEYGH
jgi:hypothetical protein